MTDNRSIRNFSVQLNATVILTLVGGLLVSMALFFIVENLQRVKTMNYLGEFAEARSLALQSEADVIVESLYAISGLFAVSDNVSSREFMAFNDETTRGLVNRHAVRWLPAITASRLDAFLDEAVQNGYNDYSILEINQEGKWIEASERDIYFPVYHIYGAELSVTDIRQGYDLYSHPEYRAIFELAANNKKVFSYLSPGKSKITEERFIEIFHPVYKRYADTDATDGAQISVHLGYANLEIDLQKLVDESINKKTSSEGGLDVYLWDENNRLAYFHPSRARASEVTPRSFYDLKSSFHAESILKIADRELTVILAPIPGYFDYKHDWAQWLAMAFSLIITFILASYLYTLQRRRKIVDKLVARRTYEVLESQERIRSILDTVVDGIITIDSQGIVQSYNPAAERIFGYKSDQVIGRNVKMLMPESYAAEHDTYLKNYIETNEARIIGIGREVTGLRSDGSTFPLELSVSEMNIDNTKMFTGIVRDITERKKMEMLKSEFVSTVSHELRTPLTSIRGALGLVLGGASGALPEKARSMLEVANRNSERLTLLINDILDLEKIESGKLQFEYSNLNIIQLAQQAVESNEVYALEHNVRLELKHAGSQAVIYADSHRLLQVFANLISNAVKFSPEQGIVEISVQLIDDNAVRVSVRDYGPGISEEFQARIFQRFAQADSSDSREKGGTGLGLNITKAIVEEHGGRINFTSPAGGGAEFYFDLPLVEGQVEVADEQSQVLICEDNADVALVLKKMLEKENLTSDIATTASTAKQLLLTRSYRALLLDLGLPDQDGLDMIRALKQDASTADMPIIVVSAMAHEGRSALSGSGIEVIDWIQKPVDESRLMNSLRQVVAREDNPRVLHIEDDADVVQIVRELLKDSAEYEYVATVKEARRILEKQVYDLVIIDLNLPDGSGLDVLPEINEKCPVIVFSGEDINTEVKHKISAHLTKATTSNKQLLDTVIRAINKHKANKDE